jgi:tetratricopeptide (TPR) repeat protein
MLSPLLHLLKLVLTAVTIWMLGLEPSLAVNTEIVPTDLELRQTTEETVQRAFTAIARGDFAEAETDWTTIIQHFPDNAAAWSNRGNVRVSQNKLQDAIADYNQAIKLAPDEPDPYLNRGAALEGLGQWQAAIADYDHVLALSPQDAAAYNNRGNAHAGLEEWDIALADYKQAMDLNPNYALARVNYALMLYQGGNVEQAAQLLRSLVRKYPSFADARAALTATLWGQGQQGEAESQWVSTVGVDKRYKDMAWVKGVRRWPPAIASALEKFLTLQ